MANFYHYQVNGDTRANVLTYNATPFNDQLDRIHKYIDELHDNLDGTRPSNRLRTDKVYATELRRQITDGNGIININGTNYNFSIDSVHKLAEALKRTDGSTTFAIGNAPIQPMPEYKILSGDGLYALSQAQSPDGTFAGMQLEVNPFNPAPGGRDAALTEIRRLYGPGANSFVNDCGSSSAYTVATTPQLGGGGLGETSVLSGVGDSSSTTVMLSEPQFQNWHQTFIPFMRHDGGVVYVYAAPYHNNQIFLWFSLLQDEETSLAIQGNILGNTREENLLYFSNGRANGTRATPAGGPQPYLGVATPWNIQEGVRGGAWTILGKVYDNRNDAADQDIPTLPDVSNYIASQGWNPYARSCLDFLLARNANALRAKFQVFLNIAMFIFGITSVGEEWTPEHNKLILFLMLIKHFGDRWRGIDSLLLSEARNRPTEIVYDAFYWDTLTGTFDSFLIRWMVLARMYGLYINKGTNLILSDIRAPLTEAQIFDAKLRAYNVVYADYVAMNTVYFTIDPTTQQPGQPQTDAVTLRQDIFNIAEWFAVFFQKARLHQPRGRIFRKIASIVAPRGRDGYIMDMFQYVTDIYN